MKPALFTALICFVLTPAFTQVNVYDSSSYPYWIEMMQDQNANFFETQKAYNKYIEGKEESSIPGWKMYRRWEYQTSFRLDEKGVKQKPNHNLLEFEKYYSTGNKAGILRDSVHWNEKGPFTIPLYSGGLGRINGMGFHPTNANIFYVAASSGGVWKTTDKGATWTSLTDNLPVWGASDVAIDFSNPNIIYMATGDRDNSASSGLGVWKSTDAGASWFASNNGMGNAEVAMMVINPFDAQSILAATSSGIYRTTDGGNFWVRTSPNNTYYKDIKYKPGDSSIVYAAQQGKFYRSTDGGWNWTLINSGLPSAYRITIGVSPASANTVYLILCNSDSYIGTYRSTDSGLNFTMRSNAPNIMDNSQSGNGSYLGHSWYNQCCTVDPTNADIIYAGGINTWKSTNGGITWSISAYSGSSSGSYVHADHHYHGFSPVDGRMYIGSDGGVSYSDNAGNSWNDISDGLSIGQVYKIGQSATSKNLLINGYQDNGTSFYNGIWQKVLGGDGMECIVDPLDTTVLFATTQNGYLRRSLNYGASMQGITSTITELPGDWVTPYIINHEVPSIMYAGYSNVWRTDNNKAGNVVFEKISNIFGGGKIKVLENSPANPDILYVSVSNGQLLRSDNVTSAGPSYTFLTSNLPTSTWPRDIAAHPKDENIVYIAQSNNIYKSTDKGLTWTDISGTLPNVSINCIAIDSNSNENLYVGTDLGVYFKGAWMSDWLPFTSGLPFSAFISELEIYYDKDPNESRIKAGTYGRGMWSSPLYTQLIADFDADEFQACPGQPIHFLDNSEGFYTNMEWLFPGGTPSSSTSLSPTVVYNSVGTYNVKLLIWNSAEQDVVEKTGFISIDSTMKMSVNPANSLISGGESISLRASGAVSYSWTPTASLDNPNKSIVLASPAVSTTYTVDGVNAYCQPSNAQTTASVIVQVGIESVNFLEGRITLYPNPVNDKLTVRINDLSQSQLELSIMDASGKLNYSEVIHVKSSSYSNEISTALLSNGLYIISLTSGSDHFSYKFMVKH